MSAGQVGGRQLHQRIEGRRGGRDFRNGSVETSVFVGDIGWLRTQWHMVLRGSDRFKRQASVAVIFILGRNERGRRRVLDKGWHRRVALVHAGDGHPVAIVLEGREVLLAFNEALG